MPQNNDPPSSDELIRRARIDTGKTRSRRQAEDPGSRSTVESDPGPSLIRPADRITPPPPRDVQPDGSQTRHTAVRSSPSPRKRGSRFLLVFAVPLIIFGVLIVIASIVGLVEGDPEVTGNVAAFIIMMALTLGPGIYLLRRYRRPQPESSTIR